MKQILLLITIFTVLITPQLQGQINFQGCPAEFGNTTYVFAQTGTTNDGGVIRNTYETTPIDAMQGCPGLGFGFCEFRIIWDVAADEWVLQLTDGGSFFKIYSNSSATAPNPPDLSVGNWVENGANTGGACGGNLSPGNATLSGDVQSSILPVEIIGFKGVRNKNRVALSWKTQSEQGNSKFEIEVSQDASSFEKIGEVQGGGTTLEQQYYSYEGENTDEGMTFYRLKQIDFDGQFEYSEIISIDFTGGNERFGAFYPNPSNLGLVSLKYTSENSEKVSIAVLDMAGKTMYNQAQQISEGTDNLSFDFSAFKSGVYIVKIGNGANPTYRKLVIEK